MSANNVMTDQKHETDKSSSSLNEFASHATITLLSTLAVQFSTFAVVAVSAIVLPLSEFARLSLITATVMLSNALFELGLNITSTKLYGDTRDERYLGLALLIRLMLVPVGIVIGVSVAFCGLPDVGLGIGLGAALNVWNGVRATDQAKQDYVSYARSSLTFTLIRMIGGGVAIATVRDASLIAIATYAVPVVASFTSGSKQLVKRSMAGPQPNVTSIFSYGVYVYITAASFMAVPYVPQFFAALRLSAADVGTYGLILTFVGPVSLVVYSLRSVLLPKMLGHRSRFESWLWSLPGFLVITGAAVLMSIAGVVVGLCLSMIFADKFPSLLFPFAIFFGGYSATAAIGFYSLSVHTQGRPKVAAVLGLMKLALLMLVLQLYGSSLVEIVSIVASVMLGFEILLVLMLARGR